LSLAIAMVFCLSKPSAWELKYQAVLKKGPEAAVRYLGKSLRNQHPELYKVIALTAELGPAAHSLWPQLVRILEDGKPEDQGAAAEALGWIGAREAIPALTKALSDRNWLVALSAVDSLGGFGGEAREALAALKQAERSYWMGYVRQRAALARAAVERGAAPTPAPDSKGKKRFWKDSPYGYGFGQYEPANFPNDTECEFPFDMIACRIGERWFEPVIAAKRGKAVESVLPPGVAKRPELAEGVAAALAVEKGWLVVTNRAGLDRELRFVPPRGKSVVLWQGPIASLTAVGPKVLAIVTHTQMSAEVLQVTRDAKARGRWTVRRLSQIPGLDRVAFPLSDDRLMVLTWAGAVSVGLDGSIREEKCPDEYLTRAVGAPEIEAKVTSSTRRSLPTVVSGIRDAVVRGHVDDTVAVLNLVLNHPRVVPFFHLERTNSARPRVVELPAVLPAKAFKVAGRDIEWVKAPRKGEPASDLRFLDLEFETETAASVAFEHRGEGMEGYVLLAKKDGTWRVAGIHVVER